MARLPWYAFLYRLFGAQGTFWLWVLSLVALWWTAKPTVVRIANRRPKDVRVTDVAAMPATDLTRWVRLRGVEVLLDRRILLDPDPPPMAPVSLLIDPSDPAASWWATTHALAWTMVPDPPAAASALGGVVGAARSSGAPRLARSRLEGRLARLEGGSVAEAFPAPGRSLLVQRVGEAPRPAPPEPPPPLVGFPPNFEEVARARLEARATLVRERVTPDVEVSGLLVGTPVTLAGRVKDELRTVVAPQLLQAGREPRDLESWVFAVASITLLFLAAGFHGATRAPAG